MLDLNAGPLPDVGAATRGAVNLVDQVMGAGVKTFDGIRSIGSILPTVTGVPQLGTDLLRFNSGYASTWDAPTFRGGDGSSTPGVTMQGFSTDVAGSVGVKLQAMGAGMGLFDSAGKTVSIFNGFTETNYFGTNGTLFTSAALPGLTSTGGYQVNFKSAAPNTGGAPAFVFNATAGGHTAPIMAWQNVGSEVASVKANGDLVVGANASGGHSVTVNGYVLSASDLGRWYMGSAYGTGDGYLFVGNLAVGTGAGQIDAARGFFSTSLGVGTASIDWSGSVQFGANYNFAVTGDVFDIQRANVIYQRINAGVGISFPTGLPIFGTSANPKLGLDDVTGAWLQYGSGPLLAVNSARAYSSWEFLAQDRFVSNWGGNVWKTSRGASNVSPSFGVQSASGGKFGALISGTGGAAFAFDGSANFYLITDTAANFTNDLLGSGTVQLTVVPGDAANFAYAITAGAANANGIAIAAPTNTRISLNGPSSGVHAGFWSDSTSVVYTYLNGSSALIAHSSGTPAFRSTSDNLFDSGASGQRWKSVFGYTGDFATIVKSGAAANNEAVRVERGAYIDFAGGLGTAFLVEVAAGVFSIAHGLGSGIRYDFTSTYFSPLQNNAKENGLTGSRWSTGWYGTRLVAPELKQDADASLTLTGSRAASSGTAAFVLNNSVALGDFDKLYSLQNNGSEKLWVLGNGNVASLGGRFTTHSADQTVPLVLFSYRTAADVDASNAAVIICGSSGASYAAADAMLSVQTSIPGGGGGEVWRVDAGGTAFQNALTNLTSDATLVLTSDKSDGSGNIGVTINNSTALGGTAKILSLKNSGSERVYFTGHGGIQGYAGAAAASMAVGGLLDAQTSSVGNVGTGEDDLHSYTLPANTLNTDNRGLIWRAHGTFANNANTKTLRLKFGSATVLAVTLPTSVDGRWVSEVRVLRSGSNAQRVVASCTYFNSGTPGDTKVVFDTSAPTQTDTSSIVIKCTGQATSNDDVQQLASSVEHL